MLRVGLTLASTAVITGWLSAPQAMAAPLLPPTQDAVTAPVLPGPVAPGRPPLRTPTAPDVQLPVEPAPPVSGRVYGPVVPVDPRNPFAAPPEVATTADADPAAPLDAAAEAAIDAALAPPAPPVSRAGRNPFLALVLPDGSTPSPTSVPGAAGGDRLLRAGSRGPDVRRLQERLAARGLAVEPDGVYGPATDAAVRRFQREAGLAVDGIVGPLTRAAVEQEGTTA